MRKGSLLALVLFVLSLAPVASAEINEVWDTYYDCALNEVGGRIMMGDGSMVSWGMQSGTFWHREVWSNNYATYTSQWYVRFGSTWTAISGRPDPIC